MRLQPLLAISLALAIGGCVTTTETGVTSENAPVPSNLRSEFEDTSPDGNFYGPFLAAIQSQTDLQHRDAAKHYLSALENDPDSRYVAERAFFQLLYSGQLEDAVEVSNRMMSDEEIVQDHLIKLLHILAVYQEEDWPRVRALLDEHLDTGFGFLITPILKAWTFAAEGDLELAEKALEVLKTRRFDNLANEHLAYMADYLGEKERAETLYNEIISSDRLTSVQPIISYAYMLIKQARFREAVQLLAEQNKRFKNQPYLLREGQNIVSGGIPSQIVSRPQSAAGLVFFRLGTELAQNNALQSAIIYMRIASFMTPEVEDTYFVLGSLFERAENIEEAIAAYNMVPLDSPRRAIAEARKIEAYRYGGRAELAEAFLRKELLKHPGNSKLSVDLADILQGRQDYDGAILYYSRAILAIKTPTANDWYPYFARGASFESRGDWEAAEADMIEALNIAPDEPVVLNHLGYSWIDRGKNIEQAKDMIARAVKARPNDGFIVDSMGWALYLTGEYMKAIEYLEQAVKLEPDEATLNDHLGDAYWRVGRKIEARFQWKHALDSNPTDEERLKLVEKLADGLPNNS
ncbi:tetratricopeptide repeat protein [Kordiimonas sp. SCSIO 12603]|uniref:tetratricopeptide repeat protein n=1 Tax=Kordiimonas sp. SCSIO 12603 TaxID=2829596 RepID=UPI00210453FA|nr:tetratricopeptide repeat protein [Kordiimonas sp. SCSIO 12603]UTW57947.1 tetratricopeptide repeat protein [Kordiimonas sp. SCSIO 12603]